MNIVSSVLVAYFLHQVTVIPTLPLYNIQDLKGVELSQKVTVRVLSEVEPITIVSRGAQRVEMLKLRFSATCARDARIYGMKLSYKGNGSAYDIDGVYAIAGNRTVSRSYTIDPLRHTLMIRFRDMTVPACTSKELIVYADFAKDADIFSEHMLSLNSVADIYAQNAEILLITPRTGIYRRSTYGRPSTRKVGLNYSGKPLVNMLTLRRSIRPGLRRVLAQMSVDRDSEKDYLLTALTLTNDGDAMGKDLSHLFIETIWGERITPILDGMDGKRVRFEFSSPIRLTKMDRKPMIQVRANVDVSRNTTNAVRLYVKDIGDIEVIPLAK